MKTLRINIYDLSELKTLTFIYFLNPFRFLFLWTDSIVGLFSHHFLWNKTWSGKLPSCVSEEKKLWH